MRPNGRCCCRTGYGGRRSGCRDPIKGHKQVDFNQSNGRQGTSMDKEGRHVFNLVSCNRRSCLSAYVVVSCELTADTQTKLLWLPLVPPSEAPPGAAACIYLNDEVHVASRPKTCSPVRPWIRFRHIFTSDVVPASAAQPQLYVDSGPIVLCL